MTGKERVKLALLHQEPDRVPTMEFVYDFDIIEQYLGRPVYWRGHRQETEMLWEGRRDEVVESYKRDLADLVEITGVDGIQVAMVPPKGFRPTPLIQLDDMSWRDHAGNLYRYSELMRDIGMAQRAVFEPLPEPDPLWEVPSEIQPEEWELIDYMVERFGAEKYISNRPGRRLSVGYPSGVGLDAYYIRLVEAPDAIREERMAGMQHMAELIDLSFEHGCDNVALGEDYAFNDGPFMSPATFERVFYDHLAAQADAVHAHNVPFLFHSCGDCRPLLPRMLDAGVDCFQAIQPHLDIKGLKRTYGTRLALWGGYGTDTVVRGTPAQMREEVRDTIRGCAPGGGLVLGASHSVRVGARRENYQAMLDEVNASGWYPIAG